MRAARATFADLDAVYALLAAAGARLAVDGYLNWAVPYPMAALERDIGAGVVFVVRDDDGVLVATYMLRATPAHAYEGIAWADANAKARYLNRLAVDPARQGEGIGRWCLSHIAESARAESVTAIRCDVLRANAPLCRFYERAGYHIRGERHHSGWHFAVFEQQLATIA